MNDKAINSIREAITNWKGKRNFTFENKQIYSYNSPITNGEFVLRFSNSLNSFFCNGNTIEISLTSRPFHTGTLSDTPISDNPNGDKYRLEKFLEEFDEAFYTEVERKLNDCIETLTTSDPLFF
jgi:hypothetical protein